MVTRANLLYRLSHTQTGYTGIKSDVNIIAD